MVCAEGQHNIHFGWAATGDRASVEDGALRACSATGGCDCIRNYQHSLNATLTVMPVNELRFARATSTCV
jgi:hypothetical protein